MKTRYTVITNKHQDFTQDYDSVARVWVWAGSRVDVAGFVSDSQETWFVDIESKNAIAFESLMRQDYAVTGWMYR